MNSSRLNYFLVLLFLALTWGSSFILMKKGLMDENRNPVFNPNQVAAMRLSFAGLALLPVSLRAFSGIRKSDLGWILLVGCFGSGFPAFLFTNAQTYIDSGLSGMLNSLTPLFTLIIGVLVFKRKTGVWQILGIAMGMIGAIGLISLKGLGESSNYNYALLIVLATSFYGLSVNIVQSKLSHIRAIEITAIAQLFISIPALFYVFQSHAIGVIHDHPGGLKSFGAVALLGLAGTAVANVVYFWLTQKTSALFASSVTYIMPIVAVFWAVCDKERLNFMHLLFGLVILTGVWLVNRKPSATTKA